MFKFHRFLQAFLKSKGQNMAKGRGKSSNEAAESASRHGRTRKEAVESSIRSSISSKN